jgi:hypothetical protein
MTIFRLHRLVTTFLILSLSAAALRAGSTVWDRGDEAEAQRLFERAQAYVANLSEGEYSYNYLQFYWKRAQSNLDRILRAYPTTSVARDLKSGQVKIGSFNSVYFKDRVLPRVEVKKLGAYDAVNCAIFLYNLDQSRWDESRLHAQDRIIEVLARQQRWNEALIFPVRSDEKTRKTLTIYRIAAHFNQPKITKLLREKADDSLKPALAALDAEGIIYLGKPRAELDALLAVNPSPSVRLAALRAMVTRELWIAHPPAKISDETKGIGRTHFSLLNLQVRDDVRAAAARFFPAGAPEAKTEVDRLSAGLGLRPVSGAPASVLEAHLAYLIRGYKLREADDWLASLPQKVRESLQTSLAKLLAEAGEKDRGREILKSLGLQGRESDLAELDVFIGEMESLQKRLTVKPATFATLPISDPCLVASAIMEWSLTPNRQLRGAAPWDSVVFRFLPGFENLPLPESDEVARAAALLKPY